MEGIEEYFDNSPPNQRGRRATDLMLDSSAVFGMPGFIRPTGNMDWSRTKKHVQRVLAPFEKKCVVLAHNLRDGTPFPVK
jgi:hypothetical protein